MLSRKVDYALEVASKITRGNESWVSVKQAAWLRSAITEAVLAGANGELGGPRHVWSLRCSFNIHTMISLRIAPNHAGIVNISPDCSCGE